MTIDNGTTRMTIEQARAAAALMPAPEPLTDEEIERRAAEDPDAALATDEQLAQAAREYASGTSPSRPKALVSLRIDQDVLEAYRATGRGWQSRMHAVLAAGVPSNSARTPGYVGSGVLAMLQGMESRIAALEIGARVTHQYPRQSKNAKNAKNAKHAKHIDRSGGGVKSTKRPAVVVKSSRPTRDVSPRGQK